jgi:CubicO group peptidase (beta-lactamase class C family)
VAGLVVERVSGRRYEQYMAERIFAPLRMTATTAMQPPPDAAGQRARGYRWTGSRQEPLPFRYTYAAPAGGVSATAADMTRVLLALLGDGTVDGVRLLSAEALEALTATQYTPDSRIPGTAYGIGHWVTRGQRLLFGDGTLGDQIGVVVLAPADRFGMFLAANALPGIEPVLDPVMNHLFGPIVPTPPPAPGMPRRAPRAWPGRIATFITLATTCRGWYR